METSSKVGIAFKGLAVGLGLPVHLSNVIPCVVLPYERVSMFLPSFTILDVTVVSLSFRGMLIESVPLKVSDGAANRLTQLPFGHLCGSVWLIWWRLFMSARYRGPVVVTYIIVASSRVTFGQRM